MHKQIISAPRRSSRRRFQVDKDKRAGKRQILLMVPSSCLALLNILEKGIARTTPGAYTDYERGDTGVVKVAFNSCEIGI